MKKDRIVGYFMESGIFRDGKELPPQKTPLILIGDKPSFNIDDYSEEDDIPVLSIEGNWYTVKKKEILQPESNLIMLDEVPLCWDKQMVDKLIEEKSIETNIGEIPIEDYKEIVALQNGFDSYEEMLEEGYIVDV